MCVLCGCLLLRVICLFVCVVLVVCQSCGTRGTQSKAAETEMVPSTKSVECCVCFCVVLLLCYVALVLCFVFVWLNVFVVVFLLFV